MLTYGRGNIIAEEKKKNPGVGLGGGRAAERERMWSVLVGRSRAGRVGAGGSGPGRGAQVVGGLPPPPLRPTSRPAGRTPPYHGP